MVLGMVEPDFLIRPRVDTGRRVVHGRELGQDTGDRRRGLAIRDLAHSGFDAADAGSLYLAYEPAVALLEGHRDHFHPSALLAVNLLGNFRLIGRGHAFGDSADRLLLDG